LARAKTLFVKAPKQQIHGHDFIRLLAFYLAKLLNNKDFISGSLCPASALMTSIEAKELRKQKMFKRLLARVGCAGKRLPQNKAII
jgi:hypothetical protein